MCGEEGAGFAAQVQGEVLGRGGGGASQKNSEEKNVAKRLFNILKCSEVLIFRHNSESIFSVELNFKAEYCTIIFFTYILLILSSN